MYPPLRWRLGECHPCAFALSAREASSPDQSGPPVVDTILRTAEDYPIFDNCKDIEYLQPQRSIYQRAVLIAFPPVSTSCAHLSGISKIRLRISSSVDDNSIQFIERIELPFTYSVLQNVPHSFNRVQIW